MENTNKRGKPPKDKDTIVGVTIGLCKALGGYCYPPISALEIAQGALKLVQMAFRVQQKHPKICTHREELYKYGTQILRNAKEHVTVVSTTKDEDFPFRPDKSNADKESIQDESVIDYFIELHGIAYKNLYKKNDKLEIVRYTDLKDSSKCHAAFSLLHYGANVKIIPSTIPVEFMTDRNIVLVGLAHGDLLFNGIRVLSPELSDCLSNWAGNNPPESQHGDNPPESQRYDCVKALAKYLNDTGHKHDDDDDSCFCRIAKEFSEADENPVMRMAKEFDKLSWYNLLYESNGQEKKWQTCYQSLIDILKPKCGHPNPMRFLDVGCGPAFGASTLVKKGVQYFGLDASKKMCEAATKQNGDPNVHIQECDAILSLMSPKKLFRQLGLKKGQKFHIIACQGNTFDHFLGPVQKALALLLFHRSLEDGGFLLISGDKYEKDNEQHFLREFADFSREYKLKWFGDYMKIDIFKTNPTSTREPEATFIMHPTSEEWLTGFLTALGYVSVECGVAWPKSPGSRKCYNWVFQRPPRNEKVG